MKKTILYIIDSLDAIGGAEVMLVSPLPDVHCFYNIIVVTLRPGNVFENRGFVCDKYICLNMAKIKNIFFAVKKLKQIIKENNIDLIHSFLYWSVVVARLASGKVPHIFSLATMMNEHIYTHKWYSGYTRIIDKITYKKSQVVIAPTNEVLADFNKAIGIKGRAEVLSNFVSDEFFFNQINYRRTSETLKLVAVGNLKAVKNYQLLIDAFKQLKAYPVTLDIYGDGSLKEHLQKQIKESNLPITLKGSNNKVYEVLPKYDVFVMSSFHEGFGISVAEAMATGLPLLLSNIKVLREVSQNNALFFNPTDPQSFVNVVKSILDNEEDLVQLSEKGRKIAKENYTKIKYVTALLKLYKEVSG